MKVVDMHCDTIAALYENKEKGWTLQDNGLHIRLDKMKQGDYLLQNFALFVCTENCEDPYQQALTLADCFDRQMALFPEQIGQVRCYNDILENQKNGRMSALLTIEEGAVCQGSLEKLREFYDRGVRMLTLTWIFPNEIGFPNFAISGDGKPDRTVPNTKDGLTEFGFLFLEEMERLGMIVDVSHLSDAGFYDVASHAKRPFVASHSDARAICPAVRNLTDDMICLLAEKGGVTGLNFCPSFLNAQKDYPGTAADVARHAAHIIKVGGEDCLGLGSDFDGIPTHAELPGADAMPVLEDALAKAGLTARQRDKVMGENVLRVYREVLG